MKTYGNGTAALRVSQLTRIEIEAVVEILRREGDGETTAEHVVEIAVMHYLNDMRERRGLNVRTVLNDCSLAMI